MTIEWRNPPSVEVKSPGNRAYDDIREELRKHRGKWGVVRRGASSCTGGQFRASRVWAGFEIAQRIEGGQVVVYARYMGKP